MCDYFTQAEFHKPSKYQIHPRGSLEQWAVQFQPTALEVIWSGIGYMFSLLLVAWGGPHFELVSI